jgi:hypothetical protein
MELFLGEGSCGKTRLKKRATSKMKRTVCEKKVMCVRVF